MASSEFNVLLFGDFEPEVVRLSKLFDPERDEFQLATASAFDPDAVYYTAEVRSNTLYFTRVEIDASTYAANKYWKGPDRDVDEDGENGKYVPSPKSIVVVDPEASASSYSVDATYGRWGTYTLLIVDSVDPTTFKSTLVPINFTGDIDNATRAVDYQNDKLMLYFDEVTTIGSGKVISLIPDRKLMMYGHTALKYVIRKGNEIISTIAFTTAGVSATPTFVRYLPANATWFTITPDNYQTLLGKYIEYYNAAGTRVRVIVDSTNVNTIKNLTEVYILGSTDNTLNNVQLPRHCYLKHGATPPIAGETYTFEVYEDDVAKETLTDGAGTVIGTKEVGVNRLIMSVMLTAKAASPLKSLDETNAVITGFGVNFRNDEGGIDDGDVWHIPSGYTRTSIIERIDPYLLLEDGSIKHIPVELLGATLFDFGLEQILETTTVGTEYDILFKYFPVTAAGVDNINLIDLLYEPAVVKKTVTDVEGVTTEVAVEPSPIQLYFIKTADGSMEVAGYGGEFGAFDPTKSYYVKRTNVDWTKVVVGESRDFLNCHRRVKIVAASNSDPRVIVPVPLDKNNGYPYETIGYDLGYLVYDNNYESPELIAADDPRIGYVSSGTAVAGPDAASIRPAGDVGVNYIYTLKYRASASVPWKDYSQRVELQLQEMNDNSKPLKWLIKLNNSDSVYGSNDAGAGRSRPFVFFDWAHEQYFIDPLAFPNKETFLLNFYYPIAGADAAVPTHFRLRSLDIGSRFSVSDEVRLETDDIVDPASISSFHTRITRKSGVGLQPLNTSGSVPASTSGTVIGTVIVEFFNKVNGEQFLAAAPVEVRLYI